MMPVKDVKRMFMLDRILQRVRDYSPQLLKPEAQLPEAAVLMPITRGETPELVPVLRPSGLSTHGGEVAYPGGRGDPEDANLMETALREAEEEVGLARGIVEVVGPLSSLISVHGIHVTPYVGIVPDYVEYRANDAEIASVLDRSDERRVGEYCLSQWCLDSYRRVEMRRG